ncbi:lantibiotic dehydratase [Chryseobacterium paridis]|uniref:Lantibiotic dehydratase n=1 Tax=Chryseobacterium paridis TaxID=2800328 RepID=A0ABS1FQF8_9FLAO|nr:lantibiotic dehydratase [Chryseobacterium paridis]MBK1894468.1 lantibiotic dehydratase [Chryseobacterium paridis]
MYESDFYAMRQPLLPLKKLFEFYKFSKTYHDKEILNYLVKEFSENYQLNEALYLASNILYNETLKYSATPDNFSDKDRKKLLHSLAKYYIRSASRCTPFGLFANFSQGIYKEQIENKEALTSLQYFPRLDMEVQYQIGDYISKLDGVQEFLIYRVNNSLYEAGGKYRYVEYRLKKTILSHHLVSLQYNEVLSYIVKISRKGIGYTLLIDRLLSKYDVSKEELVRYVDELIFNKVLTSNLDINVSGRDYFDLLLEFLEHLHKEGINDKISEIRNILLNVKGLLLQVSNSRSNIELYKEIHKHVIAVLPHISEKNLIQLDVIDLKNDETFSIETKKELKGLINMVSKFSTPSSQNSWFEVFKRAFKERYEDGKVKLAEALDGELGIGYKSARSLRDFYDTGKKSDNSKLTTFVLYKYHQYLKQNKDQITIDATDIKNHFNDTVPVELPHVNFFLKIYPQKKENLIQISSLSSSLGNNLLGRFCSSHNMVYNNLHKLIDEHEEQNENYIYAEVIHLPQARAGNVIARPHFGKYEIPYLSNSVLPEKQKIYLDDLYIQLINNELFLFSRKLKRPIKPRLSNAHNFSKNGLPIYHFLCDMQYQGNPNIKVWDWGIIDSIEECFPRVMYRNYILEPKKWMIKNEKFLELKKCKSLSDFKDKFGKIKRELSIYDLIVFKDGDNTICLDISTSLGMDMLWKIIDKKDKYITLYESLLEDMNEYESSAYHKEIIVPFINKGKKYPNIRATIERKLNIKDDYNTTKVFIPGSHWIYLKIYLDFKFINKILFQLVDCIENKFVKKGIVEKWFFTRYSDPKQHLRLRLYVNDLQFLSLVMNACYKILAPLVKKGYVSNIVQDTYIRELTRYGGKNIINSETLFYYDSLLIYNIYNCQKSINYSDMFLVGYYLTENYLNLSNISDEVRLNFLERQFNYYAREFDYTKDKIMRNTLHEEQRRIKDIVIEEKLSEDVIKLIKQSSLKQIIDQVKTNVENDYLNVLSGYIHMSMNRLFIEKQRFNEFKIYFFLFKKYQSIKARKSFEV